jgi:hypothetical protein
MMDLFWDLFTLVSVVCGLLAIALYVRPPTIKRVSADYLAYLARQTGRKGDLT